MTAILFALLLVLAPFRGPALPGSIRESAKFSVGIVGNGGQTVSVRAIGVPRGYIASFCTNRVCAPFAVSMVLPPSGRQSIELQLIENVPGARRPAVVRVAAAGARTVSIAFARGSH